MSENGRRNGVPFHRKDDRSALPGPRGSNTLWRQTKGEEWGASQSEPFTLLCSSLFGLMSVSYALGQKGKEAATQTTFHFCPLQSAAILAALRPGVQVLAL